MKQKIEAEIELIEGLKPYAPRLLAGPNFMYRRALSFREMRAHENNLGEWRNPPVKVSSEAIGVPPIPNFGEDGIVPPFDSSRVDGRVFSVVVEFTIGYTNVSGYVRQSDWTLQNFNVGDPFVSGWSSTSEMIALSIYPEAKILKCRVLYGFVEWQEGGKYMLDGLGSDRLLRWTEAMLDSAIKRTHYLRVGRWFIMRAKVVSVNHSTNSLIEFKYYAEGLESDISRDEGEEETSGVPTNQ